MTAITVIDYRPDPDLDAELADLGYAAVHGWRSKLLLEQARACHVTGLHEPVGQRAGYLRRPTGEREAGGQGDRWRPARAGRSASGRCGPQWP